MEKMTSVRFEQILEAYGTDISRWPVEECPAALEYLSKSNEARQLLEREKEFEMSLDEAFANRQVDASELVHLQSQIIKTGENIIETRFRRFSRASRQKQAISWLEDTRKLLALLFDGPFRLPGLYAGMSLLGVIAGATLSTAMTTQSDAISHDQIVQMAFASNTETALENSYGWDE